MRRQPNVARPNGHDTHRSPSNASEPSTCPYCGQEIGGDRLVVLARIEKEERTRLGRLEVALKQQFVRAQQQAQAKAKAEAEKARKEGAAVAEKKLKLIRDRQAQVVSAEREAGAKKVTAAVNAERLQHAAEKLALEEQVEAMKRRLQRKTPHQLGEPGEIDLHTALSNAYGEDQCRVLRVPKGQPGSDIVIEVLWRGAVAGKVIIDAKNHRKWSSSFVSKIKLDQKVAAADYALVATSVLPKNAPNRTLHVMDGVVLVTDTGVVVTLVELLRRLIIQAHQQRLSGEARNEKAEALLTFVTSSECIDLLDQFARAGNALIDIEVKEVTVHQATWRKRGEYLRVIQKSHEDLVAAFDAIMSGADPMSNEGAVA